MGQTLTRHLPLRAAARLGTVMKLPRLRRSADTPNRRPPPRAVQPSGGRHRAFAKRLTRNLGLALSLLTAVAAMAAAPQGHGPVTIVDDRGHPIQLAQPARRIVSLLPSLTETVCALGACQHLIGVDRWSNWPAAVQALPKLGGLADTVIERIATLQPDLVLAPRSSRAIPRLEALGFTVLVFEPQTQADAGRTLEQLGRALGRSREATALAAAIAARVAAAARRLPSTIEGQTVYFEVSEVPHAASTASFIGALLKQLGLSNIVPGSLGAFPQINPEFVVRANPDVIITAAQAAPQLAQRPGWAALSALRTGRVCALPSHEFDALVRPGPRLGEAADILVACLTAPSPKTSP